MKALLLLLGALTALLGSACEVERTCDEPNSTGRSRCPTGYQCVSKSTDPVFGKRDLCVKEAARKLDETCSVSEECEGFSAGTTVCADQHRTCPTVTDSRCDLRCRKVCQTHGECGPAQICWSGGGNTPGVCQEGECGETHRACPSGLQCSWFKSGDTGGICFAPCEPLRQNDCNSPSPPQDALCCAPQETCVHFASNPSSATCLPAGQGTLGALCSTTEENNLPSCQEGLFCSDQLACPAGGCTARCVQYCNRGGGAPTCNQAGAQCRELPGGSNLAYGYCE